MPGESGVMTAEAALASAMKKGDKKAQVAALQECMRAYGEVQDNAQVLKAAKLMLEVQKALNDTKGQAQTLLKIGQLNFVCNNLQEALANEEAALGMYKNLGDDQSQDVVKEAISRVADKAGDIELAPNRPQGLAALAELENSIQASDATRFLETLGRCRRMASVSDKEIEDKMVEALEKNYFQAAALFKNCCDMDELLPDCKATMVTPHWCYFNFRKWAGLHYGPAFQCVKLSGANIARDEVYSPIVIPDGQQEWEYHVAYNAGCLDCQIQGMMGASVACLVDAEADRVFAKTFAEQEEMQKEAEEAQQAFLMNDQDSGWN